MRNCEFQICHIVRPVNCLAHRLARQDLPHWHSPFNADIYIITMECGRAKTGCPQSICLPLAGILCALLLFILLNSFRCQRACSSIYSDIFIRIPCSHTNYAPSWYTNFESFMCTTSFPSRSIESFCLLFSSFYDLTPKGAAKGRNNQNAPISGGGGENMEMQGRENVCPEVWQHGATGKSVERGRVIITIVIIML